MRFGAIPVRMVVQDALQKCLLVLVAVVHLRAFWDGPATVRLRRVVAVQVLESLSYAPSGSPVKRPSDLGEILLEILQIWSFLLLLLDVVRVGILLLVPSEALRHALVPLFRIEGARPQ